MSRNKMSEPVLQFVETLKIENGKLLAADRHQERMELTIRHFFPSQASSVPLLERIVAGNGCKGVCKARVVYGEHGVEKVEYAPYQMRRIGSLQVVVDDGIRYDFKSADRNPLNALLAKRGECDDIIIIKQGLVRDTSFTNLAVYDGSRWTTPRHPLLAGTKRAVLVEKGLVDEADLTADDLKKALKVRLFNAMIDFGEIEVDGSEIRF